MSEDGRALEDAMAVANNTAADLADFKQTVLARLSARPTGTIEQTLRTTPAPGTLLLQGQTVNRADYPALWAWIVEQGLSPSVFGAGDGSTTFVLPDASGRFLINGGTLGPNTYTPGGTGGAADVTLTSAQIPGHTHPSTSTAGAHDHTGTQSGGSHAGHNAGSTNVASALSGSQDFFFSVASSTQVSNGAHAHDIPADGNHTHTVNANTGGGGAHENRPPYLAVGGLQIYT